MSGDGEFCVALRSALLRDRRALVSEHPGTTRDTIEETAFLLHTLLRPFFCAKSIACSVRSSARA